MAKKKSSTTIQPDDQYRAAMRVLIGERWADLWAAMPAAIAGEDIEGVHQVRVASRRLRAAMDVAVGCFPDKWYRPLQKAAKEITGALGDARDQDVLLEAFTEQRRRMRVAERAGIDHLIAQIKVERTAARTRMIQYLNELDEKGIQRESAKRFPAPEPGK